MKVKARPAFTNVFAKLPHRHTDWHDTGSAKDVIFQAV